MTLTILMALCAYRLFRFQALDTLPVLAVPRERVQDYVAEKHGDDWADGLTCLWCMGAYWSVIIVLVTDAFSSVPLPGLQMLAVSTIVGFLGSRLED